MFGSVRSWAWLRMHLAVISALTAKLGTDDIHSDQPNLLKAALGG